MYKFIESCVLTFGKLLLYQNSIKFYCWLHLKSLEARFVYWVYLLWASFCCVRLIGGFFIMELVDIDHFFAVWMEPWGYRLTYLVVNKYVLIALAFYQLHVINNFHFLTDAPFRYFWKTPTDMVNIFDRFFDSRISFVHRLLGGYLISNDDPKIDQIAADLELHTNPFANRSDVLRSIYLAQILDFFFGFSTFFTGLFHIFLGGAVSWLFIATFHADLNNYKSFRYVFDSFTALMLNSFVGIWCPLGLATCAYYHNRIILFSYKRVLSSLRFKTRTGMPFNAIIKDLRIGERMFVYILNDFIELNEFGLRRFFSVSAGSVMVGSLFASLYIMMNKVDLKISVWLGLILCATFLVIALTSEGYIIATNTLYEIRRYLNVFVQPKYSRISVKNTIQLNLWLNELVNPRRKFVFSFSVYAKIQHRSLLFFIPFYWSLICYIIPLLQS